MNTSPLSRVVQASLFIESVAKAILAHHDWTDTSLDEPGGWDALPDDWKAVYRNMAKGAVEAVREADRAPTRADAPSGKVHQQRRRRLSALAADIEGGNLFGGTRSAEAAHDIRAILSDLASAHESMSDQWAVRNAVEEELAEAREDIARYRQQIDRMHKPTLTPVFPIRRDGGPVGF